MSCPSWSKRMESRKQIQNDPNAPNATIPYANDIEKISDLLSDMLWRALWDKFVQLFQPTHQFSWKNLLEHDHQKVCAPLDVPLRFYSQWKQVAVNDGDELLESTPSGASAPSILQAAEGIVRTVRKRCPSTATGTVSQWRCVGAAQSCSKWWFSEEFENKTRQKMYAISAMGCNVVSIFFEWHASFHGFVMICLFAFLGNQQSNAT